MSHGSDNRKSGGRGSDSGKSVVHANPFQIGVGHAIAHHGELLQGVFEGHDGRLHRGLLTLPYPLRTATATF